MVRMAIVFVVAIGVTYGAVHAAQSFVAHQQSAAERIQHGIDAAINGG